MKLKTPHMLALAGLAGLFALSAGAQASSPAPAPAARRRNYDLVSTGMILTEEIAREYVEHLKTLPGVEGAWFTETQKRINGRPYTKLGVTVSMLSPPEMLPEAFGVWGTPA